MRCSSWVRTSLVMVVAGAVAFVPLGCQEDPSDPTPNPSYTPCTIDDQCTVAGEVCDTSRCDSCCPGAPPGSACIAMCCGRCVTDTRPDCSSDSECREGVQWCEGGKCVPCDNPICDIDCVAGMVPARNGCQPCECAPYGPCMSDDQCGAGEVCDTSGCLSCCPDAGPDVVCIAACCGMCVPDPGPECSSDSDCRVGLEWCEGGRCVPCDNSGEVCDIGCPAGLVPPRNGCQPCRCASYLPCTGDRQCDEASGEVCDLSECLSCCPDAGPDVDCITMCCGRCAAGARYPCEHHGECAFGAEWCIDGVCAPCDNSGLACLIGCVLVDPIHGCQPCRCASGYTPCMSDDQCPERCDLSECLSCCPDAAPGTSCIDACCGACAPWLP
ncbi:MAG: hypothetical protein QME96_18035 [Myxococcota bacterium]|nr:hypothetical protein [Myxococcota bacterium]